MLEAYENRLPGEKLSLLVSLPFISVHIGALFALTISPSPFALFMVFLMYFIRMFGITAGFHRFFSHKTFKTSRAFQFILAYLATSSAQMGPIWWASHHRHHHNQCGNAQYHPQQGHQGHKGDKLITTFGTGVPKADKQ